MSSDSREGRVRRKGMIEGRPGSKRDRENSENRKELKKDGNPVGAETSNPMYGCRDSYA